MGILSFSFIFLVVFIDKMTSYPIVVIFICIQSIPEFLIGVWFRLLSALYSSLIIFSHIEVYVIVSSIIVELLH